ncbi:5-formyltetrahydrofolate cyclo-ligase [Aliidiomarina sedimenti]|uniref:5-formyltetrahydrofolate cyclo-ligase n=1 Tax=Aliidiomarina sedimenti TaxID=1933879 RepID=A0ABY0BVG3_9GAMM|nr:5-formyltetrahydrofolate cyclo-ligase [Aliidiomarina sedimenti]RUO28165.1 5-formyltetrahydrofolate cyclo-ligase [Aliidiomarina sedimenti]
MQTQKTTSSEQARSSLRERLISQRNALNAAQQQDAASALTRQALALPELQQARRIGLYHSVGGELNTAPLIDSLLEQGKQLALPVLHPFNPGHLLMLDYSKTTPMRPNRFAIPEPVLSCQAVVPLAQIDCLLIPLVGFDPHGNRLGMGGGFYDRTLAPWLDGKLPGLTVFGLAHDCQQVEQLPVASWDVPINGVITPGRIWRF